MRAAQTAERAGSVKARVFAVLAVAVALGVLAGSGLGAVLAGNGAALAVGLAFGAMAGAVAGRLHFARNLPAAVERAAGLVATEWRRKGFLLRGRLAAEVARTLVEEIKAATGATPGHFARYVKERVTTSKERRQDKERERVIRSIGKPAAKGLAGLAALALVVLPGCAGGGAGVGLVAVLVAMLAAVAVTARIGRRTAPAPFNPFAPHKATAAEGMGWDHCGCFSCREARASSSTLRVGAN
jgi:hypothetical protein